MTAPRADEERAFLGLVSDELAMPADAVAALSRGQRANRLGDLIAESHRLVDLGIERFITSSGHRIAGVVILFSGGNDSTVLAHLMRGRATHAAHANTGVGIEETRQFVRNVCASWGLPLIERAAPRPEDSYRALVLERGFPGPGQHWKMYQRLKERALRLVRNEIAKSPREERVVFLAGRRRTESDRRADVPEFEREGSIVWVSPLVHWTKVDMMTYRLHAEGVPKNRVSDLIHMSGECLCGAYAKSGEAAELEMWFPDAFREIRELEALIADREDIPVEARKWGWGGVDGNLSSYRAGRLCGACRTPMLDPSWAVKP